MLEFPDPPANGSRQGDHIAWPDFRLFFSSHHVHAGTNVLEFRRLSFECVFVQALGPEVFSPRDNIILAGETADQLFFSPRRTIALGPCKWKIADPQFSA